LGHRKGTYGVATIFPVSKRPPANVYPWDRGTTLQARVVEHYRQPFEAVLQSPDAHSQLGEFDLELSLCQLVGPLVFAWMIGLFVIDHQDCARIVDDFLAAHRK
jgi:hypothetical protein